MTFTTKISRIIATVAAAALVATGAFVSSSAAVAAEPDVSGVAPIEQRNAATVTADALPTVQLDSGIVWTQVMNGNIVYAGGSFSQTRPANAAPGTNLTPRSNLLAFDVRTGNLLPFAPAIKGTVKSLAVSPDGRTLYVGGSFNKVGDTTRFNVAAFDTATGQLSTTFKPAIGGSYVNAIVATDTTSTSAVSSARPVAYPAKTWRPSTPRMGGAGMGADHRPPGRLDGDGARRRQAHHRRTVRQCERRHYSAVSPPWTSATARFCPGRSRMS